MKGQIPWELLTNPKAILAIVISLVILNIPIIPVNVVQTTYENVPISYQVTSNAKLLNTTQFLFFPTTKAQITIKNTDDTNGIFYVNFIFGESGQQVPKTESASILPGEEKIIETDALSQQLVSANVIPSIKSVPHQSEIQKYIPAWSFLAHSY